MFSQKCKYAIRTILYLAAKSKDGEKMDIKKLSKALKIPTPFLSKILQELVPKKIISSVKGPNGGFFLTEQNLQLPVIKIIEAIDGLALFEACGLGLKSCCDKHPCPIHNDFKIVRDLLKSTFSNQTIRELAKEINSKRFTLIR
ncbi:MAG: Rrf2 family transcriptional regulator [Bacteroidia bacterium]